MTRMVSLLIVICVVGIGERAGAVIHVGTMAGVNFSELDGRYSWGDPIDFSGRTVFGGGLILDLGLTERISIVFEPMYLQKSGKFSERLFFIGEVTARPTASYLELPLLLKFSPVRGVFCPYLALGLTYGFLLESDFQVTLEDNSAVVFVKDATEDSDFGYTFGGGLDLRFEHFGIFLETRYTLGEHDVWKGGEVYSYTLDDADVTTEGLQVLVGVTRRIGSRPGS